MNGQFVQSSHKLYILSIVVLVVVFLFTLLGLVGSRVPELFSNRQGLRDRDPDSASRNGYFDPYVPLEYNYYEVPADVPETPMRTLAGLQTPRAEFSTQIATNWYDTQGILF